MKKHRIWLIVIAIIMAGVLGGLIAYAQTEAREELCRHDNGSDGKNHGTGRKLSAAELAEFDASTPDGFREEATCEGPYAPPDGVPDTLHGFGGDSLGNFKVTAYT